jgi:hypothetical protein
MQLLVTATGGVYCIYDEAIPLATIGSLTICRASHVEPDTTGHWRADLLPVQGPCLGPFATRGSAIAAERTWLEVHWLSQPSFTARSA